MTENDCFSHSHQYSLLIHYQSDKINHFLTTYYGDWWDGKAFGEFLSGSGFPFSEYGNWQALTVTDTHTRLTDVAADGCGAVMGGNARQRTRQVERRLSTARLQQRRSMFRIEFQISLKFRYDILLAGMRF
jgi:hypothetical protein